MDKYYHFLVNLALALFMAVIIIVMPALVYGILSILIVCLAVSITKEWCDKVYGSIWDWKDFGADVIGMVVGVIIFICMYLWLKI